MKKKAGVISVIGVIVIGQAVYSVISPSCMLSDQYPSSL